jgi:hypothetical protein
MAMPAEPAPVTFPVTAASFTGVTATSRIALSLISFTSTCIASPIVQPLSS